MDSYLIRFGKNLKSIRIKKRFSQENLAEKSGLHRTYIGGIERGERNVSLKNIISIAKSLNIDPQLLFQGILTEDE